MTTVDWIAAAVIALAALNGLKRGLIGGAFSLAGIVVGAYLGAKLAPELLSGSESPYTPLVALGGAVLLGVLLQSAAGMAGTAISRSLFVVPPLRVLDSLGGLALGAAAGAAIVWVAGAVALNTPGQTQLREEVQRSRILSELNERCPAVAAARRDRARRPVRRHHRAAGPVGPPDPALLQSAGVRAARFSVLRVTGSACGLGVEGSGWIVAPELVVTNAHVVAGMKDARVDRGDGEFRDATVVVFDPEDDVAILKVKGLRAGPLTFVDPVEGQAVAILGYPENGPFTATPARIGQTGVILTDDAYGRGPIRRRVTTLRGVVRHGNSGGPAVDGRGRVQATIFAARVGSASGYAVPREPVFEALRRTGVVGRSGLIKPGEVSSGPCVR